MRRKLVTNVLLILAAASIGYLCFQMARPFLVAISWAAVLATVIDPLHRWLRARLKRPALAAAIGCLIAMLCIVLPLTLIGVSVFREVMHTIHPSDSGPTAREWLLAKADMATQWVSAHLGVDDEGITKSAQALGTALLAQTTNIIGGVAGFFLNLVIIMFTLFFFLRDRDRVLASVRGFMPLSTENATEVLDRTRAVVVASVIGGGAVAAAQGMLGFIGYSVLGVDSPALWGLATAVFSFVPLVGAAGIWVPVAIVLAATGHWQKAIILGVWGGLGISLVDNFLRPIIVGDATKLHTLLIFFSILGGLQVFGFLGIIMGPVVVAVGLALVDIFQREVAEEEARKNREAEVGHGPSPGAGAPVLASDPVPAPGD